ncbi:MAG: transcriptional regulator [Chitinophagaceae bacterium]|nr:MAG: transcriptional regulator [Chitinophagaceae bacterium]
MTQKQLEEKIKYLQDFHTAINGKWKLQILILINHGKNRFKDIQAHIPKITNRVLSKELKDLEANQMITRTVYDTIPVTIEYKATEYSLTIKPVIEMMTAWGKKHRKKISGKSI